MGESEGVPTSAGERESGASHCFPPVRLSSGGERERAGVCVCVCLV